MNSKTIEFFIALCSDFGLNPKKVYEKDFETLQALANYDMYGEEPSDPKLRQQCEELLTRAAL
jgi:hypothetical protein